MQILALAVTEGTHLRWRDIDRHALGMRLRRYGSRSFAVFFLFGLLPQLVLMALGLKIFGSGRLLVREIDPDLGSTQCRVWKFNVADLAERSNRGAKIARMMERAAFDQLPAFLNAARGELSSWDLVVDAVTVDAVGPNR